MIKVGEDVCTLMYFLCTNTVRNILINRLLQYIFFISRKLNIRYFACVETLIVVSSNKNASIQKEPKGNENMSKIVTITVKELEKK